MYTLEEFHDWQSRCNRESDDQLTRQQCKDVAELVLGTTDDLDIALIELNIGPFDTSEEANARKALRRYQRLRQCPDCALWYQGKSKCPDCG